MKNSVTKLTLKDVQSLRRNGYGTNEQSIFISKEEVREMKEHLETLYTGNVQMSFAEKIACRNKVY